MSFYAPEATGSAIYPSRLRQRRTQTARGVCAIPVMWYRLVTRPVPTRHERAEGGVYNVSPEVPASAHLPSCLHRRRTRAFCWSDVPALLTSHSITTTVPAFCDEMSFFLFRRRPLWRFCEFGRYFRGSLGDVLRLFIDGRLRPLQSFRSFR